MQAADAAEAAKLQAAKAAALAQKQVQMEQLEQMKQRILEERWVSTLAALSKHHFCSPRLHARKNVPQPCQHAQWQHVC